MKIKSAPIQLLDLTWKHTNSEIGHSWERLNHAMGDALRLAIGSGMKWEIDDFEHVRNSYDSGRWLRTELAYTLAVIVGNMSAVLSIEKALNRQPIIADDVDPQSRHLGHGGFVHRTGERAQERLAEGFEFAWKGERVRVTSWGEGYVTACSYKRAEATKCASCGHHTSWPGEKVARRFRITREDVIADRAERKEREELRKQLETAVAGNEEARLAALAALGTKTEGDFKRLPIAKLRKVVAKFAAKEAGS